MEEDLEKATEKIPEEQRVKKKSNQVKKSHENPVLPAGRYYRPTTGQLSEMLSVRGPAVARK